MYCLDAHVDADNEVRLIDLFVDSLNLSELGFKVDCEENGRPAFCFPWFRARISVKLCVDGLEIQQIGYFWK
ncbi:MAG: hypothetical protein FJZ75_03465 [Bacteroidetes bacterium]|nr:hypothetical protein [Bacteroidota bacterium]